MNFFEESDKKTSYSNQKVTVPRSSLPIQYRFLLIPGIRHVTYRDSRGVSHSYFFSWEYAFTKNVEVDWLDARNICRRHCMDTVSIETPQENEFIKQRIAQGNT